MKAVAARWRSRRTSAPRYRHARVSARLKSGITIRSAQGAVDRAQPRFLRGCWTRRLFRFTIRYIMNRREGLEYFLRDGTVDMDSNFIERTIRPQTIVRKN
ncbi:MAG: IS66 family transposase, partial [Alphaproteobacteria bacterium]|nr:IS66 family transposase [Alphaproteobacteria bacterium]